MSRITRVREQQGINSHELRCCKEVLGLGNRKLKKMGFGLISLDAVGTRLSTLMREMKSSKTTSKTKGDKKCKA